jgi:hypothetical protein
MFATTTLAASGHTAAAPPSSVMNSRRPMKAVICSLQPEELQCNDSTIVPKCLLAKGPEARQSFCARSAGGALDGEKTDGLVWIKARR